MENNFILFFFYFFENLNDETFFFIKNNNELKNEINELENHNFPKKVIPDLDKIISFIYIFSFPLRIGKRARILQISTLLQTK